MKIVIAGASGFVGQNLVPFLTRSGAQLLLVGRDPARLSEMFPGIETCRYEDLATRARGWDKLVHLAVLNNDSTATAQEFVRVNVDFLVHVAEIARLAGIRQFLNVSSIHALDSKNHGPYAESKRQAARRLAELPGLDSLTVYLPAVYGDRWAGSLSWLNRLPRAVALHFFELVATLKPTLDVQRLADVVLSDKNPSNDHGGAANESVLSEFILTDGQHGNAWYSFSKRAIDLLGAAFILIALCWLLLLLWALVRLDSPGPGLFAQNRIGLNGREFVSYKFRSMKTGTPQAGTHEVSAYSVTRIGNFLRRTKLDELPQVWNILRNDMSLVGPRPCLPLQKELIEARKKLGVLKVKPGISGLAQINGIDMSNPHRLANWDARYIALRSLLLDARIALATIVGQGQGDRVKT